MDKSPAAEVYDRILFYHLRTPINGDVRHTHNECLRTIEKAFQDAEDRGAARERQRWVRTRKVA